MKNNLKKEKLEKKYPVLILLTEEEHNMLVAFAKLERRTKSNAALVLVKDSLLRIFPKELNSEDIYRL